MKSIGFAAIAALLPAIAAAQPVVGPYVSLGAGVNLQQDEILRPDPAIPVYGDHHYGFDAGFAGHAAVGYGFGYGFRAEIEGDYLLNSLDSFGPSKLPQQVHGQEQKYGGFGNVLYDIDLGLPVFPYIGAGLGGLAVEHDTFSHNPDGVAEGRQNTQSRGSYAYQGIVGVAYPAPFLRGLSFTLEYRFMGLFDPVGPYQQVADLANPGHPGLSERKYSNDLNHEITIGVRYALWQPPAAVVAQQQQVTTAPPPAPAPEPARTYLVFFDWDRADLTDRARQIVSQAAQASTHVQTTKLEVNGYTDLSGTAAYNQKLSVRRAQAVEAELVRDGVNESEISIHGYGESNPLVPTAKGVREPQNRRVEIILH